MGLKEEGPALLAGLYRAVLRVHRHKLPPPMRSMGDGYAREEFRRHMKPTTTDAQWSEFYQQWSRYVNMLSGTADGANRSGDIPQEELQGLSAEQLAQLQRLRREIESTFGGAQGS